MKRPRNEAPMWRWKLYNTVGGYNETGKAIKEFFGTLFDGGTLVILYGPLIIFAAVVWKLING